MLGGDVVFFLFWDNVYFLGRDVVEENCGCRFVFVNGVLLVVAGLAISARSRPFGVGVWCWFLVWEFIFEMFCGNLPCAFGLRLLWDFAMGFVLTAFSVDNLALSHGDVASFHFCVLGTFVSL